MDESLLDELPERFLRRRGPGGEKVLTIEMFAGIAVNCDPADFQHHFLRPVEVLKSRERRDLKRLQLIFGMSLVLAIVLAVPANAAPKHRVAMVLPGEKTDEALNQYTCEGMMRAAKDLGIETAYKEDVTQDQQLEVIRQFVQRGCDIIIGQGGQFGEALQTVAQEYPKTNFVFSVATNTGGSPM